MNFADVDTLDPVKAFLKENISLQIILNETFVAFPDENTVVLQVASHLDLNVLRKNVKMLEDWLNVSVNSTEREIRIRINT